MRVLACAQVGLYRSVCKRLTQFERYTQSRWRIGGFFYFKHPKASSMTPVIRAEVQQAMEGTKSVQAAMNDMQKRLRTC